jgi:hypothetical protein
MNNIMSKNSQRYKEDYTNVDLETLEELEPKKFERIVTKKDKSSKKNRVGKQQTDADDRD